jgi:hypothetical protein
MPRLFLCALLASAMGSVVVAAPNDADAILGQWQGTSLCTNREVAPACKDEKTRYTFTRVEGSGGKIHCAADKIVNGEFAPMGEMDFDYVPAARQWKSKLETPSVHAVWSFGVDGDRLSGTLVDVPTGAQTRKVSAARQK